VHLRRADRNGAEKPRQTRPDLRQDLQHEVQHHQDSDLRRGRGQGRLSLRLALGNSQRGERQREDQSQVGRVE